MGAVQCLWRVIINYIMLLHFTAIQNSPMVLLLMRDFIDRSPGCIFKRCLRISPIIYFLLFTVFYFCFYVFFRRHLGSSIFCLLGAVPKFQQHYIIIYCNGSSNTEMQSFLKDRVLYSIIVFFNAIWNTICRNVK